MHAPWTTNASRLSRGAGRGIHMRTTGTASTRSGDGLPAPSAAPRAGPSGRRRCPANPPWAQNAGPGTTVVPRRRPSRREQRRPYWCPLTDRCRRPGRSSSIAGAARAGAARQRLVGVVECGSARPTPGRCRRSHQPPAPLDHRRTEVHGPAQGGEPLQ